MKAIPILKISSIKISDLFYSNLGFQQTFLYQPDPDLDGPAYAGYEFAGAEIHLSSHSGDSEMGCAVYISCDDVDSIFDQLPDHMIEHVVLKPTDQTWGNREMYIRDPDGNALRFCAPVRKS